MRVSLSAWPTALLSLFGSVLLSYGTYALDETTMNNHLTAGANLLGTFQQSSGALSNWMSTYNDSMFIQDMNIPGTHDSLTWSLSGISATGAQTQDLSLFDQLNNGVRFVDLRIGQDGSAIRMYHSDYLLDGTAQLEDIFWGMYHWLDNNPTETVLVSVKVDNGNNTASLQQSVYNLLTGPDVADYWVQNFTLGTLGESRHKLIPVLRFDISPLNVANYTALGPDLASGWADNKANFSIPYAAYSSSGDAAQIVYIEDLYNPDTNLMKDAVSDKISALKTHLTMAMSIGGLASQQTPALWYIAFASGYNGITTTPKEFAEGSSLPTSVTGVNAELLPFLTANKGRYFGVLMFDFYGHDLRMANATLGWDVASSALLRSVMPFQYLVLSVFVTACFLF